MTDKQVWRPGMGWKQEIEGRAATPAQPPASEADVVERLEWTLALYFSGNRQPCMSGDPRDRLSTMRRRDMEDCRDAVLSGLRALGVLLPAEAAALRRTAAGQQMRGDNHWETLRSIRQIARESGDLKRIIQWVDDAGSGYTETAERTLACMMDRAHAAYAERDALAARLARAEEALRACVATIEDYLAYEHDGDPWREDARTMGEMDINEFETDGRLAAARAALTPPPSEGAP